MSAPKVHPPLPTPRRGKRIMWLLGAAVLLSLAYAGWMMTERPREAPNPAMSRQGSGLAQ